MNEIYSLEGADLISIQDYLDFCSTSVKDRYRDKKDQTYFQIENGKILLSNVKTLDRLIMLLLDRHPSSEITIKINEN